MYEPKAIRSLIALHKAAAGTHRLDMTRDGAFWAIRVAMKVGDRAYVTARGEPFVMGKPVEFTITEIGTDWAEGVSDQGKHERWALDCWHRIA